jgi:phosphatidylserine/phosphatidylglycerophosphate/cardiolipin synthase-like enzyme
MFHPLSDISVFDKFAAEPFAPGYDSNRRTLFSPDDDVHGALQFLLNSAQQSIDLAMYAFTDPTLNQVLTACATDGIKVRLTLDSSQFKDDREQQKLETLLTAAGVDYSVGTSEKGAIMHLKSGVIDGTVLFTGSTNWSDSGEELQDNSLTVSISPAEAAQFTARFSTIHTYQQSHGGNQP